MDWYLRAWYERKEEAGTAAPRVSLLYEGENLSNNEKEDDFPLVLEALSTTNSTTSNDEKEKICCKNDLENSSSDYRSECSECMGPVESLQGIREQWLSHVSRFQPFSSYKNKGLFSTISNSNRKDTFFNDEFVLLSEKYFIWYMEGKAIRWDKCIRIPRYWNLGYFDYDKFVGNMKGEGEEEEEESVKGKDGIFASLLYRKNFTEAFMKGSIDNGDNGSNDDDDDDDDDVNGKSKGPLKNYALDLTHMKAHRPTSSSSSHQRSISFYNNDQCKEDLGFIGVSRQGPRRQYLESQQRRMNVIFEKVQDEYKAFYPVTFSTFIPILVILLSIIFWMAYRWRKSHLILVHGHPDLAEESVTLGQILDREAGKMNHDGKTEIGQKGDHQKAMMILRANPLWRNDETEETEEMKETKEMDEIKENHTQQYVSSSSHPLSNTTATDSFNDMPSNNDLPLRETMNGNDQDYGHDNDDGFTSFSLSNFK